MKIIELPPSPTHKRCPKCKHVKGAAAFNRNRGSYDGLQPYCRDCAAEDARQRSRDVRVRRAAGLLPTISVSEKRCARCKTMRPAAEMGANVASPDGLSSYCKVCHRDHQNMRKYGLTPEEFRAMREEQDNRCAICTEELPLVVDHCHDSGLVRGLLCNHCNTMLGLASDNVAVLQSAIDYITGGVR